MADFLSFPFLQASLCSFSRVSSLLLDTLSCTDCFSASTLSFTLDSMFWRVLLDLKTTLDVVSSSAYPPDVFTHIHDIWYDTRCYWFSGSLSVVNYPGGGLRRFADETSRVTMLLRTAARCCSSFHSPSCEHMMFLARSYRHLTRPLFRKFRYMYLSV